MPRRVLQHPPGRASVGVVSPEPAASRRRVRSQVCRAGPSVVARTVAWAVQTSPQTRTSIHEREAGCICWRGRFEGHPQHRRGHRVHGDGRKHHAGDSGIAPEGREAARPCLGARSGENSPCRRAPMFATFACEAAACRDPMASPGRRLHTSLTCRPSMGSDRGDEPPA